MMPALVNDTSPSKTHHAIVEALSAAQSKYLDHGYTGFLLLEHGETPMKITKRKQGGPLKLGAWDAARMGLTLDDIVARRVAGDGCDVSGHAPAEH